MAPPSASGVLLRDATWACDCPTRDAEAPVHLQGCGSSSQRSRRATKVNTEVLSSEALTSHSTIRTLVETFAQAEHDVRAAFASLVAAQTRVNAVFTLGGQFPINVQASRHGNDDNFEDPDRAVDRMARDAWRCIVERLELRRMMSIERWAALEELLSKGELPPITQETVEAFAQQQVDALPAMLTEAVHEVFDWLRPRRGEYKTNGVLEVGSRVVLRWMVERAWSGGGVQVRYGRQQQQLIALENVFSALDGKGSIAKSHYSSLETALKESGPARVAETDLFRARGFANGNLHLTFKRLDLLKRFNEIAGGRNLRPAHRELRA